MTKHRIELGEHVGGAFVTPAFGEPCVCCNVDPQGRTQEYNASTERQHARIQVPVCSECKDHALQTSTAPVLQGCALVVGVSLAGLGVMYRAQRPGDALMLAMIVVGTLIAIAAVAWIRRTQQRDQRERALAGHHPRLVFSIAHGRSLLDTTNEELVARLLVGHAHARELAMPRGFRMQGDAQIAPARVVSMPPPPSSPPPQSPAGPLPDKPAFLDR